MDNRKFLQFFLFIFISAKNLYKNFYKDLKVRFNYGIKIVFQITIHKKDINHLMNIRNIFSSIGYIKSLNDKFYV